MSYRWEYRGGPIRVELAPYEVIRGVVELDRTTWDRIRDGGYRDLTGQFAVYIQRMEATLGTYSLQVTIDTRLAPEHVPVPILPEDPRLFQLQMSYPDVADCLLSIDLGNTRTMALVVDNVNQAAPKLGVYALMLDWVHYAGAPDGESFESRVSLINPDEDWADGRRSSFVKLGAHAIDNERKVGERGSLSSPKRYYAEEDCRQHQWLAGRRYYDLHERETGKRFKEVVESLNSDFARRLAGDETAHLPPAHLLTAMMVEIYEQAMFFVSSSAFKQKTRDPRARRLRYIHVTYPSTFSAPERERYIRRMQTGISRYLELFRISPSGNGYCDGGVQVASEIDEASAVLSMYVYSEIYKCNTNAVAWLKTVGRYDQNSRQDLVRIGVIDIGGGTTDLSIADVCKVGMNNTSQTTIRLMYQDGWNSAGDNFLVRIVNRIAFPKLVSVWLDHKEPEKLEAFRQWYNSEPSIDRSRLARTLWYDFAIQLVKWAQKYLREETPPQESVMMTYRIPSDAHVRIANATFKEHWNHATFPETYQLKFSPVELRELGIIVKESFGELAAAFGKAITAFDCDLVLFAGKTSEFYVVTDLFREHLPLDPESIIPMRDYKAGRWCALARDGVIADPKVSTALGGALCELTRRGAAALPGGIVFNAGVIAQSSRYEWGLIHNLYGTYIIDDTTRILSGQEVNCQVMFSGAPLYIARRRLGSCAVQLCHEIRARREIPRPRIKGAIRLMLSLEDGLLKLTGIENNQLSDFTEVSLSDFECRIKNFADAVFWLDHGEWQGEHDI